MTHLLWSVFGLALAFFASPGPINIESVRRGVAGGPWPAFAVQCGAIGAELVLGVAVLFGLAPVIERPGVQLVLTLASASLLLWLAWTALRTTRHPSDPQSTSWTRHGVIVGALCAASNPLTPLMWLTVAGMVTAADQVALAPAAIAMLGIAYALGALVWAVLLAALIGWSRTLVQPHWWRWWNAVSGLILGGYGVSTLR